MSCNYFNFLSVRAFNAGAEAFKSGFGRHAPAHVGTYSTDWVEGWDEAFLASVTLVPGEFKLCY
jgi:hypothetical protein